VSVPRKMPQVLSTALLNFMREWSGNPPGN
jgi:hypothetical protein